jgi:hypothetical protein
MGTNRGVHNPGKLIRHWSPHRMGLYLYCKVQYSLTFLQSKLETFLLLTSKKRIAALELKQNRMTTAIRKREKE